MKLKFEKLPILDAGQVPLETQTQVDLPEFSPMDPPDPYLPPNSDQSVPYEEMPPFLQGLMDDHKAVQAALDPFEDAIGRMREEGLRPNNGLEEAMRTFFSFYDEHVIEHQTKEEKLLFPLLHERMIEVGEHSQDGPVQTGVDVLEGDHVNIIQFAALTFNFLGMAARLPDPASRAIVLDAALQQGSALVELLRLHMFREDHVAFALAAKHFTADEFDAIERRVPADKE